MPGNAFRPFGGDKVGLIAAEEARSEIDCFADEVAIDFPSVAPAVARIRRAFLADERPVAVTSAIRLSRAEVITGVTVPLEVPVRCTCRECGGRGESWTEPCARCTGGGTELLPHLLQVTVPAGVSDGARFHFTVTPRHHPPTRIELVVLVVSAD